MTPPRTGERRAPSAPAPPDDFISGPVQPEASRVKSGVNELMDASDEQRIGEDTPGPSTPASERPGVERFGADAVPLRPAADRDAEDEREERLRLVAAGSRRRSPLRQHRGATALVVVVIGFVALVVVQITSGSGGGAPKQIESVAAASDPQTAPPTKSLRPSLAIAHAVPGRAQAGRVERDRHPGGRRRHQRRTSRPRHHVAGSMAGKPAEPAPEPETAPTPEPVPTPEPEPASTTPAPEPTSSPESKTAERSQVETQFGFEK